MKQQRKLGNSVDWDRERFTYDEGLSKAVRDVFVTLYERGLIYKGHYLVNWCTRCGTALADDEVDHTDTDGAMISLGFVTSPEFIERYCDETEFFIFPIALEVDYNMYQELINLVISRRQYLEDSGYFDKKKNED